MALLTAGYWQTTYWPSRYWQADYWLEYGTAVTGGDSARYYYMQPQQLKRDKKEVFLQVKNLLQALKGE